MRVSLLETSAFGRGLTSTTPSTGPVVGIRVGVVEEGEGEEGGRKADKAVGGKERESEEYQYGLRGMPAT